MFSIEEYYKEAHSGEKVDNTELLNYIKSFPHVVLWGGSYLGEAVGEYLLQQGVAIDNYWDMRADILKEVNGIPCILPFETKEKKERWLFFVLPIMS